MKRLIILLAFLPSTALGLGYDGHRIVCQIASRKADRSLIVARQRHELAMSRYVVEQGRWRFRRAVSAVGKLQAGDEGLLLEQLLLESRAEKRRRAFSYRNAREVLDQQQENPNAGAGEQTDLGEVDNERARPGAEEVVEPLFKIESRTRVDSSNGLEDDDVALLGFVDVHRLPACYSSSSLRPNGTPARRHPPGLGRRRSTDAR